LSPTLDENTKVPLRAIFVALGIFGGGIATFAGGIWYLGRSLQRIDSRLETLEARITAVENSDNLTSAKASELALRAAIANPGLKLPDPRNPSLYIRVEVPK
jgi:hypothetical protein